jgi:choline dehydrogenase
MTSRVETFDYIIVGGGTAGCVLADRLSASGRHTVLVLEAGGNARSPWIAIPAGFSKLLTDTTYNWRFETEPEENTRNRVIAVPRGKGLGGSTLINGMIYVRGQPQDYDTWAQLGCRGWSFDDVLPYFRKIENFDGSSDPLRGASGPVPITAEAFIDAAAAAGHRRNPDYNAADQDGFGYYQVNQRNGRRITAFDAYLKPAMKRANLTVETGVHVTRLELDGKRATGVVCRRDGVEMIRRARGEVILCAGAIQSAQLLELSGIGEAGVLADAGIPVRHALPGVGNNYIDHFCTRMNWRVSQPVTLNESSRGWRLGIAVAQYFLRQSGILTLGTGLSFGFVKTRPGLERPDAQFFFMHASYANAAERRLDRAPGMTIGVTQLRPESRGSIHIRSADPDDKPVIRPNFLSSTADQDCMIEGMRIARAIVERPEMDAFRHSELSPGRACQSDADWLDFARHNGQTIYHAAGTCRMGNTPDCVVDPRLRVHGMDGLRVVDASIMPTMVSGNTQAAVLMIAENASDMILEDAKITA